MIKKKEEKRPKETAKLLAAYEDRHLTQTISKRAIQGFSSNKLHQ